MVYDLIDQTVIVEYKRERTCFLSLEVYTPFLPEEDLDLIPMVIDAWLEHPMFNQMASIELFLLE